MTGRGNGELVAKREVRPLCLRFPFFPPLPIYFCLVSKQGAILVPGRFTSKCSRNCWFQQYPAHVTNVWETRICPSSYECLKWLRMVWATIFTRSILPSSLLSPHSMSNFNTIHVFLLQKRVVQVINNSDYRAHSALLFAKLGILDIFEVSSFQIARFMFYFHNQLSPPMFLNLFETNSQVHYYDTRIDWQLALVFLSFKC